MMEENPISITTTQVTPEVQKLFQGMSEKESIDFQLTEWVDGNPLHNPIRDECCPDFSCCNGGNMMPKDVRIKFSNAHKMGDAKTKVSVFGMALSGLMADSGVNARIAGDDILEN